MKNNRDKYIERHTSEYKKGDKITNSFSFFAGQEIKAVPRLMLNPYRYLATYVWTEHTDKTTLETNWAVCYGSSEII